MSKFSNRHQVEHLIKSMQAHPEMAIATTGSKDYRERAAEFWNRLEVELNGAGPPVKSVFEWKRVWADQKKYVRNKANKEKKILSVGEEAILKLITMSKSPAADTDVAAQEKTEVDIKIEEETLPSNFGEEEHEDMNASQPFNPFLEVSLSSGAVIKPQYHNVNSNNSQPSIAMPSSSTAGTSKRKRSCVEVVEEEISIQKKICDKIGEGVDNLSIHHDEIQSTAGRMFATLHKMGEIQERHLKETIRHNLEMERLKKLQVENQTEANRRLIELKQMKIKLMTNRVKNEYS